MNEPPIEHPYRTAAYHLLTRGDFVAGDIRYRLNRTIGRDGWSGHRDGPLNHHVNGGASYSGPSLATVLEWTLFPLGPIRVWTRAFTGYNGTTDNIVFYAHADCPLGCGRVQRTCEDQGYGPDGVTRYGYHGCEHFLCEKDGGAVFIEYRDLVRECECGQDTDANTDRCWNCGETRVSPEEDSRDE